MDEKLRLDVLKRISPTIQDIENKQKKVSLLLRKLKKSAKKLNLDVDFVVGGSFSKGTDLKGSSDIDIFVRFNLKYKDENISNFLKLILDNSSLKYNIQKGSRNYYSLSLGKSNKKVFFELVPVRRIQDISDAKNSTDFSVKHIEFFKQKSLENSQLCDEVRLAKQFFKKHELYGAESYIGGFSGHSIEILIAYYGSLEKLILNAKNWGEQKIIDIANHYQNSSEILKLLDKSKHSNLILIDPILKSRNAAKALSEDKYASFLLLANMHKTFTINDFQISKLDFKDVILNVENFSKKNGLKSIIYKFNFKLELESQDIVGSKLLKLHQKTKKFFQNYDFKVFYDEFFIDFEKGICLFILVFEKQELSKIKLILGPKVYMGDAVKDFLQDREDYFVKDFRVAFYGLRRVRKLEEILKLDLDFFKQLSATKVDFLKKVRVIKK